jgi:CheY-like chemotaxis protein
MQMFGGDIICESKYKKWTKFSLLFPKVSEEELANNKIEIKRKKILLVDDQEVNLIITKLKLEKIFPEISCDIARGGEEAIRMANQNKYQLILMDIQMPEIDGIAATKLIREFDNKTPISAFTTLSKKEFKKELNLPILNTGFNDYLYKELSANLLFRSVGKWISGFQNNFQFVEVPDGYKKSIEGKRILLADDQEFNLELTKKFLENNGLKITKVNNGKELVDLFKENSSNFDLIITDIKMPIISGDEASLLIRDFENLMQIDNHKYIPIIALSGDGEKNDISKFFKSEINDFFVKGDSPENLLKLIYIYTSN